MLFSLIVILIAFVSAITVHEAAHAWMSDHLGDPTARLMGRLSLNPIVHYDPVGTTLLLVLSILAALHVPGIIPFGWAKPVEFDPYNLKNPRRDAALISLAGPGANFILAICLSILLYTVVSPFGYLHYLLGAIIYLNIILGVFNLIPIHPLDGGKIFIGLLPEDEAHEADLFLRRYGMLILIFLIFPTFQGSSPISIVMSPILNFLLKILIPGQPII